MDLQIWLVISVLFYCAVVLVVSARLFFVKRATLTEPVTHFVFFLSLFTLPLPIRLIFTYEIAGNISSFLFDFIEYVPVSVFMSACSLIVFYFSYYSELPTRLAALIPTIRTSSSAGAVCGGAVIAGGSLFLLSLLVASAGGFEQFLLLGYASTEKTFGAGYLAAGFPWLFVANMFLFIAFVISRRVIWLGVGLAALAVNLGLHLVLGARSMILYILITFGTFFLLKIKHMNWKMLLLIGVVGFGVLNFVGHTRKSGYTSFSDFVEKTVSAGENSLTKSNDGFFYTLTIGEFVVPFETLPQMVRTVGFELTPWFGLSYLRAPIFLIPSIIYPDRPPDLASWYVEEFYGQQGHINEGRQFFFLAEGYLNFGPLGVLLISAIWGLGWRTLREWLVLNEYDPGATMIYALGLGFMFRCISGTFVSFVSGFTQQSLAIAIIGLMIAGARFYLVRVKEVPGAAPQVS